MFANRQNSSRLTVLTVLLAVLPFISSNLQGCAPVTQLPPENAGADHPSKAHLSQKEKTLLQVRTFTEAGFAAGEAKNFDKAIEQFQKAIAARAKLPADDELAQLYANLAWGYMNQQNWVKGKQYYAKALSIASPKCAGRKFYERDLRYAQGQIAAAKQKK